MFRMKEINKKLLAVQQQLRAPKSQYNEFNKFNYRNAEDILEAVKPLLVEQGLLLTLSDQIEYIGERYYIRSTVTITDGEDEIKSTAYAREDESRAGMSESQVTGCSSSYARKYALQAILLIDSEKDSDSFDNRTQKTSNKTSAPKKSNSEQLKDFCSQEKLKEGVDIKVLKKFYEYYDKIIDSWDNKPNFSKLWNKWVERERS